MFIARKMSNIKLLLFVNGLLNTAVGVSGCTVQRDGRLACDALKQCGRKRKGLILGTCSGVCL